MKKYGYVTKEIQVEHDGKKIYGVALFPQGAGEKLPAVIFSHGFGGNHSHGLGYGKAIAEKGYVFCCYDFCGGGFESRSDGTMTEMSIFTEKQDLEAVIAEVKSWDCVDANFVFLLGASQGGAVSAITAGAHPEAVKGMMLLYPAFVLVDDAKKMFKSVQEIPETYEIMCIRVGCMYAKKLLDYDIYDDIIGYSKDVLIIHGDADPIVPLSYAERAVEVYASAKLEVIPGAGHGFEGKDDETATAMLLDFLGAHC